MRSEHEKQKKTSKLSTALLILAIVIVAAVLAIIILIGISGNEEQSTVRTQPTQQVIYGDEELGIDATVDEQLQNYRNIALFGIDAEDLESENGHRSDAIIVLSMNKETDEVKMFSVYRDTYLDIGEDYGLDKINHAYAYGGIEQSLKALNQNLDLNIREGMALTWKAVADLVDSLDGIEVDIQESERTYMNGSLSGESQIRSAGKQTINGEQAVLYARIRKDSSRGDYRRNERIQTILTAALNKAKTLPAGELMDIMDDTLDEVTTNMSYNRMTDTLIDIASYDLTNSVGWPYKNRGWTHNSVWYGVPATLESNVKKLHKRFFDQDNYEPTALVKEISERIKEKTNIP